MCVNPKLSYLGTLERYVSMAERPGVIPRATPKEHHDLVVSNIIKNVNLFYKEKSFTEIKVYNRDGEILSSLKNNPGINPADILKQEFSRHLATKELDSMLYISSNLTKKLDVLNFSQEIKNSIKNFSKEINEKIQEQTKKIPKINSWNKIKSNDRDRGR